MLALYRSGRQAEALEAYHDARRTLVEELGIEPGPELQELYGAMLRQERRSRRPPPRDGRRPRRRGRCARCSRAASCRCSARRDRAGLGGDGRSADASLARALRLPARARRAGSPHVVAVRRGDERRRAALRRAARALRRGLRARARAPLPRRAAAAPARSAACRISSSSRRATTGASSARSPRRARSSTSSRTSRPAATAASSCTSPPTATRTVIEQPNTYAGLSLERRTRRAQDPRPGRPRARTASARASSSARTTTSTTSPAPSVGGVLPVRSRRGCAAATSSSSATRSTTGACGSSCAGLGRRAARLPLVGGAAAAERARARVLARARTSRSRHRAGRVPRASSRGAIRELAPARGAGMSDRSAARRTSPYGASRRSTTPSSTPAVLRARARDGDRRREPLASRLTVLYGPSGVGKSSLLRAGVARRCAALGARRPARRRRVVARWSRRPAGGDRSRARGDRRRARRGDPADAPERRSPIGSRRGRPCSAASSTSSSTSSRSTSSTTARIDGGRSRDALAELVDAAGPARERAARHPRRRARAARRVQGARSRRCSRTRCASTSSTATRRAAAIVGPLGELRRRSADDRDDGRARARRRRRSTRSPPGGSTRPGRARGASATAATARVEAPYLQLVMQRLWEVERARGSVSCALATLERLGGAARIVEEHLERALAALDAPERGRRGAAVRPPRHAVGHEDRARRRRSRRYAASRRGRARARCSPQLAGERILRPLRAERRRSRGTRSSTTCWRTPCSPGARGTRRNARSA